MNQHNNRGVIRDEGRANNVESVTIVVRQMREPMGQQVGTTFFEMLSCDIPSRSDND